MRKLLTAAFFGAGVLHVIRPAPFDSIVPPQLPGSRRFWTYASGAAELVTAALLSRPATRRAGGLISAGLLAAVWPANFYMVWLWRNESRWRRALALGRLPLQVPMILAAVRIWRHGGHAGSGRAA